MATQLTYLIFRNKYRYVDTAFDVCRNHVPKFNNLDMDNNLKVIIIAILAFVMASCAGKQGNNVGDVVEITPSFTEAVHKYDELYPFSEGLAAVKKNEKFGFINTKGELVIPCQYQYAGSFKEGLACVVKDEEDNNISFIDAKGEILHTKYPFNPWYYMGGSGQTYIGPAISFTNGVCEIKYTLGDNIGEEPQTVYIDRQMKEVAQPAEESTQSEDNLGYEIFSVSDKDIYGEETSLVGVKDKDGEIVIPAKYYDLEICDNGVVLARMFIESAESRFYQAKIGYGLTVYGYIDFTGKSTFTDADMGKLEGYKEAQIPAMAQLKLEAVQVERQAQYEEEQRRIEEEQERRRQGEIVTISTADGYNSLGGWLKSAKRYVPKGKVWIFKDSKIHGRYWECFVGITINGNYIESSKHDLPTSEYFVYKGGSCVQIALHAPSEGNTISEATFIEKDEEYCY